MSWIVLMPSRARCLLVKAVTATGTFGTATRQITAVISRNTLTINGAANLPGMQADTYMNGVVANQTIDGRDWVRSDTNGGGPSGTGPLRFGITTQPGIQTNIGITYEQNVENAFNTVTLQNTVLTNQQSLTSLQINQMTSAVLLVEALGGGWDTSQLPTPAQVSAKPSKADTRLQQ